VDDFGPYSAPDPETGPAAVSARLLRDPQHKHITDNDIVIEYLMCSKSKRHQGRSVTAAVHLPKVQGKLGDLFEQLLTAHFGMLPDFLMIVDGPWWKAATAIDREALVWHELMHIQQETNEFGDLRFDKDGVPVYGLREHDVTAFHSEVARYGAWSPDLQQFVDSINQKQGIMTP
jgi:hypothetical protein